MNKIKKSSQIKISLVIRKKLEELKEEFGAKTFNEVINLLIEKYKKKNKD